MTGVFTTTKAEAGLAVREESWIAAGVLTTAIFAALLWQTMKLTRSPW